MVVTKFLDTVILICFNIHNILFFYQTKAERLSISLMFSLVVDFLHMYIV